LIAANLAQPRPGTANREDSFMITAYLNFSGKAREAASYYTEVFGAPAPYIMAMTDMPKGSPEDEFPAGSENLVAYANVKTFAGDIMLSDDMPGGPALTPNSSFWICLDYPEEAKVREVFEKLAKDGRVIMALEPTFFNPLYGQLVDKYGYHWMMMLSETEA